MEIYNIFRKIYTEEFKHESYQAAGHNNDEVPARAEPASEGSSAATRITALDPRPPAGEMADHARGTRSAMLVHSMA